MEPDPQSILVAPNLKRFGGGQVAVDGRFDISFLEKRADEFQKIFVGKLLKCKVARLRCRTVVNQYAA